MGTRSSTLAAAHPSLALALATRIRQIHNRHRTAHRKRPNNYANHQQNLGCAENMRKESGERNDLDAQESARPAR